MLLIDQPAIMRWHARNKEYYTSRGYKFTKMRDEFQVKVEDLPKQSHAVVKVQCDVCGRIYDCKYQNYNNRLDTSFDTCHYCEGVKIRGIFQTRYGVDNPGQLESVKEKSRETCLEKYGVPYYSQTEECREKAEKTCLERYGASNYSQTEEYKQRVIATSLEKRGVPFHTQDPEVIRKIMQSFEQNGTAKISQPQIELGKLLQDIYGNCELNKSCEWYCLDCVVNINGILFDFEYDGEYWHRNRKQQDCIRDSYIQKQGYKIIRILGNREIPSKEEIVDTVNMLLTTGKNFKRIITDIN